MRLPIGGSPVPEQSEASVLLVCTANLCRSPMAQLLLEHALATRAGAPAAGSGAIHVSSAGTRAVPGGPAPAPVVDLLGERGIDATGHRSRALTSQHVDRADLVLTATRDHRAAVARLRPAAASRTFTLLELAWLLDGASAPDPVADTAPGGAGDGRLASLVAMAHRQRGRRLPDRDLDLPDPYGRRLRVYQRSLAAVEEAVASVADRLTGAGVGGVGAAQMRRTCGEV